MTERERVFRFSEWPYCRPPQWWERPGTRPCMVQHQATEEDLAYPDLIPAVFHQVADLDVAVKAMIEFEDGSMWFCPFKHLRFIDGGRW